MTNKTWLFASTNNKVASYLSAKHCRRSAAFETPATEIHKHCRDIAPEMRNSVSAGRNGSVRRQKNNEISVHL